MPDFLLSSSDLSQLNPRQQQAVHYIDGPCLVLAGAGSGKTSVITRKIAYLIDQCGLEARHIAALTFTNKAAKEMKERASGLLKGKNSKGLTVSTFHNLGLNIVRREYKHLGFKPGFSIFDAEDARSLLKELLLKDGDTDTDQMDRVQYLISQWKNDLVDPDQALSLAESPAEQAIALVYERYNKALMAYNALDFDDLILTPVHLFNRQPEVLQAWQRRIRYLLVDEYQDTNSSQYLLVKQLVGARGALTVVGDDDQSIYAWRGARPENMAKLKQDYPNLQLIKLEQNYRSTQRILKVANQLIAQNPHEFDKVLWSDKGLGAPIRIIRCTNEEVEAERIATEILSERLKHQGKFRDFTIVYRGNHQSRLVELKLQHHQIPYNISGGTSFFSRTEIKDIMAYLRLLVNPDDDNAFLRIINTPRRQIGTTTLETLGRYATEREVGLFAATQELGLQNQIPQKSFERIQSFTRWIQNIVRLCEESDPIAALKEMIEDMDYEGWLHQQASSSKVAERRMENVHYLINSIAKVLQKPNDDDAEGGTTMEAAIAKLVLQDLLDRQEEEDLSDRVQMMTLHASKGLEFPHVYLLGFEEELLPHRSSVAENNVEEERRLCYVGITRAQKTLTVTLAGKRKQYGEVVETTPSRFLEELPEEDLELEGFLESDPNTNKSKGTETINNLLGMLD